MKVAAAWKQLQAEHVADATAQGDRPDGDYFRTPADVVEQFLAAWGVTIDAPRSILEPAAGDGAMLAPLRAQWPQATIDAFDIMPRHAAVRERSFFMQDTRDQYDLVITNPPYAHAWEFAQQGLSACRHGGHLALLLRAGFLESQERHAWLKTHMPEDVFTLSKRPSFRYGSSEPRTMYAWFVFKSGSRQRWYRGHVL